ncbi:ribonuclease HI family protein [Aquifex pyrophilus]
MKGTLYFDGASKGNPGRSGIGAVLVVGNRKYTFKMPVGEKTNNQAEYLALIAGMLLAKRKKVRELTVRGDSKLVINQMRGSFKVNDEKLMKLYRKAKELEKSFKKVSYEWVKREENKEADRLANEALKTYLRR